MILLALNELNIDYIKGYVNQGKLTNFRKLLAHGVVQTSSEYKYELLEPWIQWTTVQTGKTYEEHQVFRLGDIINRRDLHQIFDHLEMSGLSVGAISPFNADNRLTNSKFFLFSFVVNLSITILKAIDILSSFLFKFGST
jgi:hypothetical protein